MKCGKVGKGRRRGKGPTAQQIIRTAEDERRRVVEMPDAIFQHDIIFQHLKHTVHNSFHINMKCMNLVLFKRKQFKFSKNGKFYT